jgi:DNA modification methylase
MTAKVLVGDCREVLLTLDANSIDACVCDPPHGLEFMGKEWDRLGAGIKVESQRTDDFAMQRGGSLPFGGGGRSIAYGQNAKSMHAWHETWAREVYRVLKPGAHSNPPMSQSSSPANPLPAPSPPTSRSTA